MAIIVIPVVMTIGFIREDNLTAETTRHRIWDASNPDTGRPQTATRGFILRAKDAAAFKVGSKAVTDSGGAADGYPMSGVEKDIVLGAIVDSAASEIYAVAAAPAQPYYLGQVG